MTVPSNLIYNLCNEKGYFTAGDNDQYDKLFYLNELEVSADELALAIWLCSDSVDLRTVTNDVRNLVNLYNGRQKLIKMYNLKT